LYCRRENLSPIYINIHQELRVLESAGFINSEQVLQPKAMSLVAKVESFFKIHKKKTGSQLMGKEFQDNIIKYNETFPSKMAGSKKYMRSNIKSVETNFRWFFETYQYTWEQILTATEKYIGQQLRENYKYTRTSMYYIKKQEKGTIVSDLADWCEMVISGVDENNNGTFSEKVV